MATDTKNPGDKTLSVAPTKTLTLKPRSETGVVRQSFSHGRTKQVVVEKVRTRRPGPGEAKAPEPVAPAPAPERSAPQAPRRGGVVARGTAPAPQAPTPAPAPSAPSSKPSGVVLRTLTKEEQDRRAHALGDAKVREAEERKIAEEEAKIRAERDAIEKSERDAAEARKRTEDDRRRHDEETKRRADEVVKKRFGGEETASPAAARTPGARPGTPAPRTLTPEAEDDDRRPARRGIGGAPVRPAAPAPKPPRAGAPKQRGRLTLTTALNTDEVRERSVAAFRRRTQRMSGHRDSEQKKNWCVKSRSPRRSRSPSSRTACRSAAVDVIKLMMKQGHMAKITDTIDADTAQLLAEELGHTVRRVAESDVEEGLFDAADEAETLQARPPVVTIMGHVDHGKTSLLDAIRSANVVSGEAGGITQHIGAYQVTSPLGGKITFIDTPGHAAFTAMRARGAKVTDIVILVVAADDGVMPQTVEAINHAKAAKVPMIVAINKVDKADSKPERVRSELLQYEVQVESLGGDVLDVEVSATKKTNLDKLLETIALQAEVLDLKANPDRAAEGTVIEATLDRGRGPVATVLVQRGTLRGGDIVVAGAEWGRVRALVSDTGAAVTAAGPSVPVEVLGFNGTPDAGDRLAVVPNEARAREVTDYRARQKRDKAAARQTGMRGSLEQMMAQVKTAGRKEFPLIIKADVQGSLEAVQGALDKLGTDEVVARIIHSGVGGITESDVTLAESSGAAIIGFNVRAHKEAREAAERTGIEIRYYNIIYNLVDDVKAAMSGLLAPTLRETMLGNAQILEIFTVSKVGKIAGCRVTDGKVERGANVRLIRDNVVIHEGKLSQLKRFKDDAREVAVGQECGMAFENYQDMRQGDVIECYRVESVQRSL